MKVYVYIVTARGWGENYGEPIAVFDNVQAARRFAARAARREVHELMLRQGDEDRV